MSRDASICPRIPPTSTRLWSGSALFTVTAWGASFVATRIALEVWTPLALVTLRLFLGAVVLTLIGWGSRSPLIPKTDDRARCVILGAILSCHLLLQSVGLQHTSAMNASWIIAFTPAAIAIGAQLVLKRRLQPIGWLGITVASMGVLVVPLAAMDGFPSSRWGDLLALTSCATWTAYTLAASTALRRSGSLPVTIIALWVASLVTAPYGIVQGLTHSPVRTEPLLALVFLGVVCSGLAYFLWFRAVGEVGPTKAGAYIYMEPFVTVLVARVVLAEPITISAIGGGLLVLGGVYLVGQGSRGPGGGTSAGKSAGSGRNQS